MCTVWPRSGVLAEDHVRSDKVVEGPVDFDARVVVGSLGGRPGHTIDQNPGSVVDNAVQNSPNTHHLSVDRQHADDLVHLGVVHELLLVAQLVSLALGVADPQAVDLVVVLQAPVVDAIGVSADM